MKRLILTFVLIILPMSVQADHDFIEFIKDKTVQFAFDDGDIHEVTFEENELGIIEGIYQSEFRDPTRGMSLKLVTSTEGVEYLRLYKGLKAPSGTYKYPMRVFIPLEYTSGETRAYVDARWGYYHRPLLFIK